jgi:FlaA1/EpsC-like NDP-sugar epimerase
MTIPEAVQLIIRAGKLASGGEVFVLEMGEQVKIIDLARNMIRLSGQELDHDIRIEIVGPRQGEKLREELFNDDERPVATEAERILKVERSPLDPEWIDGIIDQVESYVERGDEVFLAQRIAELARQPREQAIRDLNALIEQ